MPKTDRLRMSKGGFTIIEVMIALAILALSLTAMAVTVSGSLSNATTLQERTYASWIAQNRIVEMRLAGVVPRVGVTSDDVEYASGDWSWEAVVAETGIDNLWRVDVSVFRADSDEAVRTVTGFIGQPIPPGQGNGVWNVRRVTGATE